jgi:hypothetical protein
MKKLALAVIAMLMVSAAPAMFAQDHGVVGVYADYVRLKHANNSNFWGLGGRVGFNVHPNVQLEGEVSYDFAKDFTISTTSGGTVTTDTTRLRLLHGLFGPKFQTNGPVRVFAVLKGGILNFSTDKRLGTQIVTNVPNGDTNGVFYPGGGIELYAGWFGIRAEVGDLMYFDRGANHNLRFTFGPQIRF